MNLNVWEEKFERWLDDQMAGSDAAHDRLHIRRVVRSAKQLGELEQADLTVVIPAAWLHDCVTMPKHSGQRHLASQMAAQAAAVYLKEQRYPSEKIPAIEHAIHAHSFSANIPPKTIEAQVVQDADRLDAIGAIGIARFLMLGSSFGIPLYNPGEPVPTSRPADDQAFVIDHLWTKLFKIQQLMNTTAGKKEAQRRTQFMHHYVTQLVQEIA